MKKKIIAIITMMVVIGCVLNGCQWSYSLKLPGKPEISKSSDDVKSSNNEKDMDSEKEESDKTKEASNKKKAFVDVENSTDEKENTNTVILTMSDGFALELTIPEQMKVSDNDTVIGLSYDDDYSASYMDSYVEIGDSSSVKDYFTNVGVSLDDVYSYTMNDKDVYIGEEITDAGIHHAYILQDVGSKNYLEVEFSDYENKMDTDNILENFAISLD